MSGIRITKDTICKNCQFGCDVGDDWYQCRRYAPKKLHGAAAGEVHEKFPVMRSNEWCGEFDWSEEVLNEIVFPKKASPPPDRLQGPLMMDDLANLYDEHNHGRPARTLPMEKVVDWCQERPEIYVDEKGDFYRVIDEEEDDSDGCREWFEDY